MSSRPSAENVSAPSEEDSVRANGPRALARRAARAVAAREVHALEAAPVAPERDPIADGRDGEPVVRGEAARHVALRRADAHRVDLPGIELGAVAREDDRPGRRGARRIGALADHEREARASAGLRRPARASVARTRVYAGRQPVRPRTAATRARLCAELRRATLRRMAHAAAPRTPSSPSARSAMRPTGTTASGRTTLEQRAEHLAARPSLGHRRCAVAERLARGVRVRRHGVPEQRRAARPRASPSSPCTIDPDISLQPSGRRLVSA